MLLSGRRGTRVSERPVPPHLQLVFLSEYKYHRGEDSVPKLFLISDFCRDAFEALVTDVSAQPETSVTKCQPPPRNAPEKRRA